jgi:hypothetical protein
MTATIYALCDSRESDPVRRVRYIGQTVKRLDVRLYKHWQTTNAGETTYRARWMRTVRAAGADVLIEPIAVVPVEDRDRAEMAAIATALAGGSPLTNATAGGDGVRGYSFPVEVRQRMSAAASRRRASPETREKMRIAMKAATAGKDMAARVRGRKRSDEHKRRIAEAVGARCRGVRLSEATKAAMRLGQQRRRAAELEARS